MADIKLSLTRISVMELRSLAFLVADRMDGNPSFPAPVVPPAELRADSEILLDLISIAREGSKLDLLKRNKQVGMVMDMLKHQADYVRTVAQGDPLVLSSSGFALRKERAPITHLGVPQNLRCRIADRPGCVDLRFDSVRGAHAYQIWTCSNDPLVESNWKVAGMTTRTRYTVTKLASAHYHGFRVNAVGAAGEGAMSNAITSIAA